MVWRSPVVCAALVVAVGCGSGREPVPAMGTPVAAVAEETRAGFLEPPFTADEIRNEWVEGLDLRIRRWTADAEAFEQWSVTAADADGVEITSSTLDAEGKLLREPSVRRSTWTELRDHASFPADLTTVERVRRETRLGSHEGWLYTVVDPGSGARSELFFAEALPGAPTFVHVFRDGELIEIFEQVERRRPRGE